MDEELLTESGLGEPEIEESVEHSQEESLFGEPTPETAPQRPAPAGAAPLALYRRYRPDTFADVIGQDHVTEPLQRALTNNRVNHAYLFSGPRGCGKTTSARILARALNCEKAPVAEPCGECQSCQDLARGGPGSIDVIEIDAASHGGVDDARDLRERAFFAPVSSPYKIYIVDEAHMVTTAGFNALLKLVEEPPPHVKFIFATTEPDKVIGTIRSRTHHYPFRLVPPRVLTDYLGTLCEAEGISVEPAVLPLVVRAGAGSVRDSLSVLDQLLGGASESGVEYRQATALLGYTPDSLLDEFADAFAAGDAGGVFSCVDKVIEVGQDPRRFAEDLLRRLRDLVIVAAVPDALSSGLVEVAGDQAERLSSQAAQLGPGELTRAAEVIALGLTDMRGTTAPRLHLELMCARVLLPGADVDQRGVHARLDRLERRIGVVDTRSAAPTEQIVTPQPGRPLPIPAPPVAVTDSASGASEDSSTSPGRESEPQNGSESSGAPKGTGSTTTGSTTAVSATTVSTTEASRISASKTTASKSTASKTPAPKATRSATSTSSSRPELTNLTSAEPEEKQGSTPSTTSHEGVPSAATDVTTQSGPESASTSTAESPVAPKAESAAGSGSESSAAPSDLTVTDLRQLWPEVLEAVKGKRRFTWMLLSQNAQIAELRHNTLLLSMANTGARDHFGRGGSEDILKEAITSVLGANFAIETMVDGTSSSPTGHRAPDQGPARAGQVSPGSPPSPDPTPVEPAPTKDPALGPTARDSGHRDQARQGIRPTRSGTETSTDEDRDAAARRDDSDIDESSESHTELLARHLGAEIIAEDDESA